MTPDRWQEVVDLFHRAVDLPESDRPDFIHRSASDPDVEGEIGRLLRFHQTRSAVVDSQSPWGAWSRQMLGLPVLAENTVLAGRFVIRRHLGHGSMGEVFAATDQHTGEDLALKVLRPELASEPSFVERFRREALLARRVTHPNVCRVHDLWRSAEPPAEFFTMELLDARPLPRGPLPEAEALALLRQLAAGLDAAHAAGVVHRDLKPANLLRTAAGHLVITDFGLARDVRPAGASASASAHRAVGTPAYLAPEQVLGGAIGPATDLYAFGVIAFELLTGERPFAGHDPWKLVVSRFTEAPRRITEVAPWLGPRWDRMLHRCLARDPAARWPSAAAALAAVEQPEWPGLVATPVRGRPWWLAPAAGLLLLAGSAAGAWHGFGPRSEARHYVAAADEALSLDRPEHAVVLLEEAAARHPEAPGLEDLRRETALAAGVMLAAARPAPQTPEEWLAVGRAHERSGKLREALEAYRQAGDTLPALYRRGRLEAGPAAATVLGRALNLAVSPGTRAAVEWALGEHHWRAGDPATARVWFERSRHHAHDAGDAAQEARALVWLAVLDPAQAAPADAFIASSGAERAALPHWLAFIDAHRAAHPTLARARAAALLASGRRLASPQILAAAERLASPR